jgi:hypothetical protein
MEPAIIQPASNACTNCGANLEYDFTTNTNKCPYCGSAFKANKPADHSTSPIPDASSIRFRNDLSKFRDAAVKFLCSGNKTPINLLFEAEFLPVEQIYIPFYQFSGTYDGYYNTIDNNGKILTQNTPLKSNFSVLVYGGESKAEGENMAAFAGRADKKLIVPISAIETEGIKLTDSQSEQKVWANLGQLQAANQVYGELNHTDPGHKHQHYLKYDTKSVSKFYYPGWRAIYYYQGNDYAIYMDDVTGELSGSKPNDAGFEPPQRSKVYKKYLLIGLGLWFGILVLRAALTAFAGDHFDIKNHSLNNIIFSEPAGLYWLLRGVFFLGLFPILMVQVLYKKTVADYYSGLAWTRNSNLDLLASGRKSIVFRQVR